MKKLWFLFIALILLASCSKTISPNDIDKVSIGMSQEKITDILGNPDKKTTDHKKLTEYYDGIVMLYASKIDYNKEENDENLVYDDYSDTYIALKEKKNVELFEYETSDEDQKIYIYFLNNEVSFFFNY